MLIRFEKLSKYYLESCALREATGVIEKGQKVLIVGENGSGKSTFLKLITGQISPSAGEIFFEQNLFKSDFRKRFSILGESKFLYLDLTLKENLELFLLLDSEKAKAKELCFEFGLDYHSKSTLRQFSSGQKQKASVVKTLSLNNEVLALDEPLNFLDFEAKAKLARLLEATDKTIVLVSHETEYFSAFKKMEIKKRILSC